MFFFLLILSKVAAAESPTSETQEPSEDVVPAELEISGYGWFGNAKLRNSLALLNEGGKLPELLSANYIEDAALILLSQAQSDGFLDAELSAKLTLDDGRELSFYWDDPIEEPLPRPLNVQKAEFKIHKGLLSYYEEIEFAGLEALTEAKAREFFIEAGPLLALKTTRIFTPQRLEQGLNNLKETLARRGYKNAIATPTELTRNRETGAVSVKIQVKQGQQFFVHSVTTEIYFEGSTEPQEIDLSFPDEPYSTIWQQEYAQKLRRKYLHLGYPDAQVEITVQDQEPTGDGTVAVDLLAVLRTGPKIRVGDIRFEGLEKTRTSVVRRQVPLKRNELLDRIKAEEGRYELARLGIFDAVELEYEQADGNKRDVVYHLEEGKETDISLLFGYGSYELFRAGIDIEQYNVFGRAHYSRLRLTQSFKSTSADYLYSMPEFFGEDVDVFFNASGLRREEVSFTREEFGAGAGARRFYPSIQSDVSIRYLYQILNAAETDVSLTNQLREAAVGAIITDIKHDKRDSPLIPREGYKFFSVLELATEYLGGDVDYERFETSFAYHLPVGNGRWISLGLTHGLVFTLNGAEKDLPFNKRFFPGGENSVRGFQQGEAAPRNAEGDVVGAETFTVANLEFEEALTRKWSLIAFVDAIAFAEHIGDYPGNDVLVSVGGGIRWQTILGPVRLEYGHNLNPRRNDPAGTIHFAIGFPF